MARKRKYATISERNAARSAKALAQWAGLTPAERKSRTAAAQAARRSEGKEYVIQLSTERAVELDKILAQGIAAEFDSACKSGEYDDLFYVEPKATTASDEQVAMLDKMAATKPFRAGGTGMACTNDAATQIARGFIFGKPKP